jgi:uncharacterized protein (TIGR02246 family)
MYLVAFLLLFAASPGLVSPEPASPETEIRKVLDDQVVAWNKGDIDSFMTGYDNSPNTTFVGATVQRGWETVRRNYHERYPNRDKMGTLDFSGIEIRMLDADYATVLGKFHLKRNTAGGGDANGVFTLLFHKVPAGWRVIQDHTS